MALQYIGIDPDTGQGNCPTVWVDDKNDDLVLQGWLVDEPTLAECLAIGDVPETEAVIRIPARMVPLIREACDVAERARS
jgi:hypothetical protein